MKPGRQRFITILVITLTLIACSKEVNNDPCQNLVCENEGKCVEGTCLCKTGYEGISCEKQITPTKISLSQVSIINFPPLNSGITWDTSSGPDLWIVLIHNLQDVFHTSEIKYDVVYGQEYVFSIDPFFEFENKTDKYRIALMDVDGGPQVYESMAGVPFIPYNDKNGFPKKVQLTDSSGFEVELSLEYVW